MSVQYLGNISYDISETIRDYDYTKKAVVNFNRLVNSKDFEKMDTESIFRYLYKQMEVVSFGDFLRRYIYELTRIPLPFNEVSDDYYISYIAESFERNRAPRAFGPVKSRWKNIIKRWLRDGSAKRDTVFLLGFGLNMTDQNVSMFLTKVIKEQDFNFDDPRETVFWHCYHGGLPYSTVAALMKDYENLPVGNKQSEVWQSMNAEMIPDTDRTKTLKTEPELTLETDLNKNPQSDVKLSQSLELAKSCAENLSRTTDISQNIDSDPESVFWKSIQGSLRIYLSNESILKRYLKYLKSRYIVSEDKVYCSFMDLYRKAVQVVSQITKNQSEDAE